MNDRSEAIARATTLEQLRDLFPRQGIDPNDPELLMVVRYDAWEVWDAIARAAVIGTS